MPDQEYLDTWAAYLKAWSGVSPAERQELVSRCANEECVYTEPASECHGRRELIDRMARSQQQYPGAYFENEKLISHHSQGLFRWTMYHATGAVLAPGVSFARFDERGRLSQMGGFF